MLRLVQTPPPLPFTFLMPLMSLPGSTHRQWSSTWGATAKGHVRVRARVRLRALAHRACFSDDEQSEMQ